MVVREAWRDMVSLQGVITVALSRSRWPFGARGEVRSTNDEWGRGRRRDAENERREEWDREAQSPEGDFVAAEPPLAGISIPVPPTPGDGPHPGPAPLASPLPIRGEGGVQ